MKEFKITTLVREYDYAEFPESDRRLIDAAKDATRTSYSPYSQFRVGAAILMADGSIVKGSNQENAAYPSGICAERTAAFYASASHPGMAMKKISHSRMDQPPCPRRTSVGKLFPGQPHKPVRGVPTGSP